MKIAIICMARKGSKRLPGKNWKELNGKPLCNYTFEFMNKFTTYEKWIMTDSNDIRSCALLNSINEIDMPNELAQDNHRFMDSLKFMNNIINADIYILLQVTTPIRDYGAIRVFINTFVNSVYHSGLSVVKLSRMLFEPNGNFYIFRKEQLKETDLYDGNSLLFAEKYKLDIDTQEDFDRAEAHLNENA